MPHPLSGLCRQILQDPIQNPIFALAGPQRYGDDGVTALPVAMQHVDLGLRGNALETMQTGNVEAELDEVVGLTPDHERAAGRGDQTDSAAGILGLQELRSITEEQRRIAHALGLDDIDRRLKLAPGAGLVLTPEIAPLVRTRDPRV